MKPGIYGGLTHADLPGGLSASGAKTLLFQSPAAYKWQREHPKPATKSMDLGTLAHALILEGETRYLVCRDGRTKEGKADRSRCMDEGLFPVTADDAALIEGIAKSVLEHTTAANILAHGDPEQAVIWADEQTGVVCRGFIDWLNPKAIVDLKTTVDASPSGFGRQAANLHYDLAAEFYRTAVESITGEALPVLHIAVENKPPHLVGVHQFPPEADERGRYDMRRAIDLYAECVAADEWPAYGTDIIPTPWPRWAA